MRYLLLLAAGLVLVKQLPKIAAIAVRAAGDAAARFDDLYSEAARKAGQATEAMADRHAERRHTDKSPAPTERG